MNATVTNIADTVENFRALETLVGKNDVRLRTKKLQSWDECLRTAGSRKARIAVGFDIDGDFDPHKPRKWYAWTYFYLGDGNDDVFIDVTWERRHGWRVHCNFDNTGEPAVPDLLRTIVQKHGLNSKQIPCSRRKAMQVVQDCLTLYRKFNG